jgi:two-component system, NarL family, sensor kinase
MTLTKKKASKNYIRRLADYTIKKGGGRMAILPVYLKLITHLTEKSHNNLLLEVYSRIRSIYESNGDYKTALQYNKLYHGLKDSVTSVQLKSKLQELEVEYETAKKQKTIDENKLLIAKKNNQKMLLASLLAIVLLAGVGTVLWLRHKLKAGKIIAAQSEKIKDQEILNLQKENKVLALNSMLEGQEAERGRVAKDLHDGLGGLLSTVKAHFSKIQSEIQQLENLQLYTKTNALIDEACVEVRRIAHNMAPESITTAGLKGAIEDLAANINIQGVQCTVEVADGINNLPQSKAVMIYRVIQEICHNAVKHSQSPTLLLQVLDSNQIIKILIEDNGVGLDVSAAEQKKGMGLKSIYSRVSYLNGTILIDSVPNKGTTINIDIPAA